MVKVQIVEQDSVSPIINRGHVFVYVKKKWSEPWRIIEDLIFEEGAAMPAGKGLGYAVLRHRYGKIKKPWVGTFQTVALENYDGYWVRLVLYGSQNDGADLWIGRIYAEKREMFGSSVAESGHQYYTAYSPLQELRMKRISSASVVDQDELKTIGWVPVFNMRDDHNMLLGNRTAKQHDGYYRFGGTETWTRLQMLEYIIKNYVDESGSKGPEWNIAGQTKYLDKMTDVLKIARGTDYAAAVLQIIERKLGFDFDIVTCYDHDNEIKGFTVQISSIAPEKYEFAGYTLPANPKVFTMNFDRKEMLEKNIERSDTLKYDSIKVLGERIVACITLWGKLLWTGADRPEWEIEGKWPLYLELEYHHPDGADAKEKDRVRESRKFDNVYSAFGARTDWGYAGPILDNEGNVKTTGAVYQTTVRGTLPILPLNKGYDYTVNPPSNENPEGYTPGYRAPLAYIYNDSNSRWTAVEDLGANIKMLDYEWGMKFETKRGNNHIFAKNVFPENGETLTAPRYDYRKMVMTIAIKTDQRLMIHETLSKTKKEKEEEQQDPNKKKKTKDLIIHVPGAELWYLGANTVVSISGDDGSLEMTPDTGQVLRNDADKLKPILCAAKARYFSSQVQGKIIYQGWQPWRGMIFAMIDPVVNGKVRNDWRTPLTGIKWSKDGNTEAIFGNAK